MSWNEKPDAALGARVDAALEAAVDEKRIVGGVVLVARQGALAHHRAVGLADREENTPMTEDTPFRLASFTKAITSIVALDLVHQGKLSLYDTVSRWLPDFTPRFDGEEVPITIKQLLTHTSGIGAPFNTPDDTEYARAYISIGLDQPGLSLEENLRRLASAPLYTRPGTAWRYSLSTDVLAAVIERVANRPFADVVAARVTGPLAMSATAFVPKDPERLATPYADAKPEPIRMFDGIGIPFRGGLTMFSPSRQLDPKSYPSGGAGISGTASDYLRFLEALRTRHSFTSAAAIDDMFEDKIANVDSPNLGPGWGFTFGAGIVRDPAQTKLPLTKGAIRWGGAWGHSWWIDPEKHLSVVLLTNTTFEGMGGKLHLDILNAVWRPL